jgi:hypothetical protein
MASHGFPLLPLSSIGKTNKFVIILIHVLISIDWQNLAFDPINGNEHRNQNCAIYSQGSS